MALYIGDYVGDPVRKLWKAVLNINPGTLWVKVCQTIQSTFNIVMDLKAVWRKSIVLKGSIGTTEGGTG